MTFPSYTLVLGWWAKRWTSEKLAGAIVSLLCDFSGLLYPCSGKKGAFPALYVGTPLFFFFLVRNIWGGLPSIETSGVACEKVSLRRTPCAIVGVLSGFALLYPFVWNQGDRLLFPALQR